MGLLLRKNALESREKCPNAKGKIRKDVHSGERRGENREREREGVMPDSLQSHLSPAVRPAHVFHDIPLYPYNPLPILYPH